jgi:2,4-dienoyl-CoA reductase (NADPH2)
MKQTEMETMKLEKLFQPAKIGSLEIANRIILTAVTTRYDFEKSDRLSRFYAERAKGGVGLIITGALQTIYPSRKTGAGRINLYDDSGIPTLKEWVKAIHDNGSRAAAQLATYNYWSKKGPEGTAESVGPSSVVLPREGIHPLYSLAEYLPPDRELTLEEIGMIQEAVTAAAVRSREAGFDAIEFQCFGGNLFHRFTNPFLNRRTDRYGGSVENRTRFMTETISKIKKDVGEDLPIICRIAGTDPVPWGMGIEYWQEIAVILEKSRVHALHVSPRWHESREPAVQMCVPRNAFVHVAEGIKKVVTIPVIANGRINDPRDAEQILAAGKTDFVGMTRPLIADPALPSKAREGRIDEIRFCTACCRCYDDIFSDRFMSCSVNPQAGMEREYVIKQAPKGRRVFILGGGPAGMEAARVAALRGHRVTLFEATDRLGGQLLYAAIPPYKEEWKTTISYLIIQLEKLKVEVKLNHAPMAEEIASGKPDAVIIATGAIPHLLDLPGIKGPNVATAIDVLAGRKEPGQNVVVLGGGSTGCETAEFLAQKGKQVTILEMLPRIGGDYGPANRYVVIDRLVAAGIRLETGVKAQAIAKTGVKVIRNGLYPEFFEADTVVLSAGMVSNDEIARALEGKVPTVFKIGDAAKPASVKEAMESAFKIAMHI